MLRFAHWDKLTFWDSNPTGPLVSRKDASQPRGWVRKEAAMHATAGSIRQRIAHEKRQIRRFTDHGFSGEVARALDAHHELIRVLSERLDGLQR